MTFTKYNEQSRPLFLQLNLLKMYELSSYLTALFMYPYHLSSYFTNYFILNKICIKLIYRLQNNYDGIFFTQI